MREWLFWEICKSLHASRYSIRRLAFHLYNRGLAFLFARQFRSLEAIEQTKLVERCRSGEAYKQGIRDEIEDAPVQMLKGQHNIDQMADYNPLKRRRQLLLAVEVQRWKLLGIAKLPMDERIARIGELTDVELPVVNATVAKDAHNKVKSMSVLTIEDFIRLITSAMYKIDEEDIRQRKVLRTEMSRLKTEIITQKCKKDIDEIMEMKGGLLAYYW